MSYEFKVEEYNSAWNDWFHQLRTFFEKQLFDLILRIEHVGSTAVPGMVAKPIIDLDLVIEEFNFNQIRTKLEEFGYIHQGDLGIEEREAFKLLNDELKQSLPPHHLYVCKKESIELKRHIVFREFLRRNSKEREEYSKIKKSLFKRFKDDRESYIEGKDSTIRTILSKALENLD